MEDFNEEKQIRKVLGMTFRGQGPDFQKPNMGPSFRIVDGVPSDVKSETQAKSIPSMPMTDPWYGRRSK